METHKDNFNALDAFRAIGEMCVFYWHERRGTLREYVIKVCQEVDDNLADFGGDDE